MSAGTITIKNNTAAVVGDGTTFTTELAAGDFIVIKAGGVTYTLPVKSVESDTALTLSRPYAGPAASGSAWTAMPRDTLNSISAQIAADTSYAIRQRVLEIDNWYQLLEVNGEVTINMADGSSYTGPSWLRLIDIMNALDIDQLIPVADQIRADAAQVAEDKPVIVQAKDDAEAAAAAAAASQKAAASSEAASANSEAASADSATAAAKSAEEAASHNPVEALVKTSNLSDLPDRAAAWLNVRPVGSTPLAADPVSAYDAATKRWTENLIGAGTTGPTMNGVMNFGVGQSIAWDSRAYIPPYCLPKDGQIVNRADWPELWAHAQQHGAIDDSAWIADVTKRGSYSKGNGTTTFRLPDWNGVQKNGVNGFTGADSIPGNFFRGGVSAADMTIKQNAAPNFTAVMNSYSYYGDNAPIGTEYSNGIIKSTIQNTVNIALGLGAYWVEHKFDASFLNSAYGRDNTTEVYPNHVSGVWIVRASGGFVAANTSWSVINGDATSPANATTVLGGEITSAYQIAGANVVRMTFRSKVTIGGAAGGEIVVYDDRGTGSGKSWQLPAVGGTLLGTDDIGTSGAKIPRLNAINTWSQDQYLPDRSVIVGGGVGASSGDVRWANGQVHFKLSAERPNPQQMLYAFEDIGIRSGLRLQVNYDANRNDFDFQDNGTAKGVNWQSTSEGRLKGNIKRVEHALSATLSMRGVVWDWNSKGLAGERGVGIIAQEAEAWCKEAVSVGGSGETLSGEKVEGVRNLNVGAVAAAYHTEAIRTLFEMVKLLAEGDSASVLTQIAEVEAQVKPFYKGGDPQKFDAPEPMFRK